MTHGEGTCAFVEVTGNEAPARQAPNDKKLATLILYISWTSEADPTFGMTKLNKLLFFSDFTAYRELGHSITGQEYRALPFGPVPMDLPRVRDDLEKRKAIIVRSQEFGGHRQDRTIPLVRVALDAFTADEIAIVDETVRRWWGVFAADISRASHRFVGWKLARPGEVIPYETALFEPHEPSAEEWRHAVAIAEYARQELAEARRQYT